MTKRKNNKWSKRWTQNTIALWTRGTQDHNNKEEHKTITIKRIQDHNDSKEHKDTIVKRNKIPWQLGGTSRPQ